MSGDPALARVSVGERVGAGILADEHTVVTCAHVVHDLGRGPLPQPTDVTLTFLHPDLTTSGTVEPAGWFDEPDLAVVRLAAPVSDRTPAPLVAPHDLAGLRLILRGFPEGYLAGDSVVAYATEPGGEAADWWVVEAEPGAGGGTAQAGFSGGPAWSDTVGGVVGMTVAADRRGRRTAFVVPVSRLVEAHPPLALLVAPWYDDAGVVSRLRESVVATEERCGPDDPRTIGARFGLGLCLLRRRADLGEAEALLRASLAPADAPRDASPVRLIGVHMALADLYGCQLREDQAWDQVRAAEALGDELLAPDERRRALIGLAAAGLLIRRGDLGEAAAKVDGAHATATRLGRPLDLVATLSARAVLDALYDVDAAEAHARDALALGRGVLPAGAPGIGLLARQLAVIHLQHGDMEAARALLDEALEVLQASFGSSHVEVGECRRLQAALALGTGDLQAAGEAAARALNTATHFYGDGHAGAAPFLLQSAVVRKVDGHLHQAKDLVDSAVEGLEAALAPDDLRVAQALTFRADLRRLLGTPDAADADAARALAIAEGRLADAPRYLVPFLLADANTHLMARRPQEAERAAERAAGILAAERGSPDPLVAGLAVTQGRALAQQGRFPEARPHLTRAVRMYESTSGAGRVLLGEALVDLAGVCRACGDVGAAGEYMQRGRTVLREMPGIDLRRRAARPGAGVAPAADLMARGLDWWSRRRRA